MANLDFELSTPDEKIRAIALIAASSLSNNNSSSIVLRIAQKFENYIKTGKTT